MASVVEALLPQCQVPHSASPVSASLASPSRITGLGASGGLAGVMFQKLSAGAGLSGWKLDNRETGGRISWFQVFSESRSDLI